MPSSLSLSPFAVIVAAIAAVSLVTFVIALAVVTTTFLTVDVSLIFDCCGVCRHLAPSSPPSLPLPSSSPSSPSSSPSSLVADCHVVVIVTSHAFLLSYCSPNRRRCLLSCHTIRQPPRRPRRMHTPG